VGPEVWSLAKGGFELIRELIAAGRWRLSGHADDESQMQDWGDCDVEACAARGTLRKTEPDTNPVPAIDGWVYAIASGSGGRGGGFYMVAKVVEDEDGEPIVLIITAEYREG
jgi:hypothetical protein